MTGLKWMSRTAFNEADRAFIDVRMGKATATITVAVFHPIHPAIRWDL